HLGFFGQPMAGYKPGDRRRCNETDPARTSAKSARGVVPETLATLATFRHFGRFISPLVKGMSGGGRAFSSHNPPRTFITSRSPPSTSGPVMRVLITGGYGFIGAWIIKNLLAQGSQVWVYDLKEDPRRLKPIMPEADVRKVTFVQGDVTNQAGLQEAIAKHQISHIIHLAGLQVPTCRANPILGATVNVVGTLCVFEAVRLAGDQVKRLVYASTAAVFGPPEKYPSGPLADDVKLFPATHYGHFKVCNEGNAAVYFQDFGLSSIGLRPWTVYGVGRDLGMTSEPTKAIKSVALGRKYHISYGGFQDFQYVDDVAKAF